MEETLISEIKRLRVLTPSDCDNMDGLVPDLSHALEETSCSRSSSGKNIKKDRSWKRRYRPSSSLTYSTGGVAVKSSAVSDDSESSSDDKISFPIEGNDGSHPQTDSDGVNQKWHRHQHLQLWRRTTNTVESDSVNENFHPIREHKRKRKFKRMAVDPQPNVKNDIIVAKYLAIPAKPSRCHKKSGNIEKLCDGSTDFENMRGRCIQTSKMYCGKRKRSIREKSIECSIIEKKSGFNTVLNSFDWFCGSNHTQSMDCDNGVQYHNFQCSSGLSSSDDSDNGFITNDEGREADDEHSDVNPTSGISTDLHSFCHLSACGKAPPFATTQTTESEVVDNVEKLNKGIFKPEHMQVDSNSVRSTFKYEGTKRRRKTPPTTYIHGESSTEINNPTHMFRCKEIPNGLGVFTESFKSSKSSHCIRKKTFLEFPEESCPTCTSIGQNLSLQSQTFLKGKVALENLLTSKQVFESTSDKKCA